MVPAPVLALLSSAPAVGFSGSRSVAPAPTVVGALVAALPPGCSVSVGCARGVDAAFRVACPGAAVFRIARGSGPSGFAARSVACVRSVAPGGVWVSFPSGACPPGLLPSASSSRCFCGSGSGSWASLALALGLGAVCLVLLPPSVVPPAGWGLVPLGGGWFRSAPVASSQLALF